MFIKDQNAAALTFFIYYTYQQLNKRLRTDQFFDTLKHNDLVILGPHIKQTNINFTNIELVSPRSFRIYVHKSYHDENCKAGQRTESSLQCNKIGSFEIHDAP